MTEVSEDELAILEGEGEPSFQPDRMEDWGEEPSQLDTEGDENMMDEELDPYKDAFLAAYIGEAEEQVEASINIGEEEAEEQVEASINIGEEGGPETFKDNVTLVVGKRNRPKREEDEVMLEKVKSRKEMFDVCQAISAFLLSEAGVLLLCIVYVFVGAEIFIAIERPNEEKNRAEKVVLGEEVRNRMNFIGQAAWNYIYGNQFLYNKEQFIAKMNKTLTDHIAFLVSAAGNNYDGIHNVNSWKDSWCLSSTLLFTLSIITTIGYGNIILRTVMGRLFCCAYMMGGLPMFFIFLAKIGNTTAGLLKLSYSRFCCRPCRIRRRKTELPGKPLKKMHKRVIDDDVGSEYWMPTDQVAIPIVICLVIITLFIGLGTKLFNYSEGWDAVTSGYFCFITLYTIGYGDYYPQKSFEVTMSNPFTYVIAFLAVSYCVIGVALISMTVSIIQENMQIKAEKMKMKMLGQNKKMTLDNVVVKSKYQFQDDGFFNFTGMETIVVEEGPLEEMIEDMESEEVVSSPAPSRPASAKVEETVPEEQVEETVPEKITEEEEEDEYEDEDEEDGTAVVDAEPPPKQEEEEEEEEEKEEEKKPEEEEDEYE